MHSSPCSRLQLRPQEAASAPRSSTLPTVSSRVVDSSPDREAPPAQRAHEDDDGTPIREPHSPARPRIPSRPRGAWPFFSPRSRFVGVAAHRALVRASWIGTTVHGRVEGRENGSQVWARDLTDRCLGRSELGSIYCCIRQRVSLPDVKDSCPFVGEHVTIEKTSNINNRSPLPNLRPVTRFCSTSGPC